MDTTLFFESLWRDYIQLAPHAEAIVEHFSTQGRPAINDHVAFRTFGSSPLSIEHLEPLILSLGFRIQGHYRFEQKKLIARSYLHPDPSVPKIFLSELCVEELSFATQRVLTKYIEQIPKGRALDASVFFSGRVWQMPTWQDYEVLRDESDYAAWLCTIGLRANHFTLSINHLSPCPSIKEVLESVKLMGFEINQAGGEIKGSSAIFLEQASTKATTKVITFADGESHRVPTCFYEFAYRYPDQKGKLFQGFVEGNADGIFDSTQSR